ncbi:MAG: hypothetical protein KC468_19820 [Myxococcales bacterium]|nr:hypothetical protein [Myxococcales bacterium]
MNRYVNRDGSELSVGPVPLPLAVAIPFTLASIWPWWGATQCGYIAAGQVALAVGKYASAAGMQARLKAAQLKAAQGGQTAGVGDDAGGWAGLRQRYMSPPSLEGNALESVAGGVDIVDAPASAGASGWSADELALLEAA